MRDSSYITFYVLNCNSWCNNIESKHTTHYCEVNYPKSISDVPCFLSLTEDISEFVFLGDLIPFSVKHYHRDSFLTSNENFDQGSIKRELWSLSQFQRLNWIKPANKKNYVDDFEWFRLRVLLRLYLVTLINMILGFAFLFHRDSSRTTKKW